MRVGVPKEIKVQENRVGLIPSGVREIIAVGGRVLIEEGAGVGAGISDQEYRNAGAELVSSAEEVYAKAELLLKVKEPQPIEIQRLREGQVLFAYLHLAPDPKQTRLLKESGVTAIAYETVTQAGGGLPLLMPASQVAGRMSIQVGAHCLEQHQGGCGLLLGGIPGVEAGNVVVLGAGVAGSNAVRMAVGLGARVTVLDQSIRRLAELDFRFGSKINTVYATTAAIERYVAQADLLVGAVLVPGAAAPKLVTRAMLQSMRPGSVLVDVSIDQGGCFETSRPTSLEQPTFMLDGVLHYCVTNMPGGVPRTSTFGLSNATLPFVLELVTQGAKQALFNDPHLLNGLNVYKGRITYEAVAKELNEDYVPAKAALA